MSSEKWVPVGGKIKYLWPIFVFTYLLGCSFLIEHIVMTYQNDVVLALYPLLFIVPLLLLVSIKLYIESWYKRHSMLCPTCKKKTKVSYNWFQGTNGEWYHECWECENVFHTSYKVIDE